MISKKNTKIKKNMISPKNTKIKKIIQIIIIPVSIIILIAIIYFLKNKTYTYICFNTDISEGEIINENYLDTCTTKEKPSKDVITDTSYLINNQTKYKLTKSSKKAGERLYYDDFAIYEKETASTTEISFIDTLEVMYTVSSINTPEYYKIFIKDSKLYAENKNTHEQRIIFDTEPVSKIASRPICCTGNANLLILTTNQNAYISEKDVNYFFTLNDTFPFTKLSGQNLVSFKLVPANDDDWAKNLYGIDTLGNEILLQKLN